MKQIPEIDDNQNNIRASFIKSRYDKSDRLPRCRLRRDGKTPTAGKRSATITNITHDNYNYNISSEETQSRIFPENIWSDRTVQVPDRHRKDGVCSAWFTHLNDWYSELDEKFKVSYTINSYFIY